MDRSRWLALLSLCLMLGGAPHGLQGQAPAPLDEPAPVGGQAAAPVAGQAAPAESELPLPHRPKLRVQLAPQGAMQIGDAVKLTIEADALLGDDVAVPEQSFAPFEITGKRVRVEPEKGGRQRFVFELDLLALETGSLQVPAVELRVVTKDGFVGSIRTQAMSLQVRSALANEPDAKLKGETQPVAVLQDDFTPLYVLGGLLAAGLIALLTWWGIRYFQRRVKPAPPPPPPRPPWEIAIEKLADLRRRKQAMVDAGQAAQFVDEVSDVAREYLGARFGFDGLESTSDETLSVLRGRGCNAGLLQEVDAYLRRCDLIKFASVDPDQDEADLVFAKAQDIVQFSTPLGDAYAGGASPAGVASTHASSGERPDGRAPDGSAR